MVLLRMDNWPKTSSGGGRNKFILKKGRYSVRERIDDDLAMIREFLLVLDEFTIFSFIFSIFNMFSQ